MLNVAIVNEIVDLWVEKLREQKDNMAHGALKRGDGRRCPLGWLCEVLIKFGPVGRQARPLVYHSPGGHFKMVGYGHDQVLSTRLEDLLGIDSIAVVYDWDYTKVDLETLIANIRSGDYFF